MSLPRDSRGFLRAVFGVFVLLTCLRVWIGPEPIVARANAQLPDRAAERRQMLNEMKRTNELLAEVLQTLKSHTFNVRIKGADKTPGTKPPSRPPGR